VLHSLVILVTVEIACILTAETVELIFYKHSIFLSTLLDLHAGSLTVVAPEAYKRTRMSSLSRAYHSLMLLIERKWNKLKIPSDVFNAGLFTNFAIPF
jgi:hypothetical protein